MIFDTHAHYDCDAYDLDRDALLQEMHSSGNVGLILNCADGIESCHKIMDLCDKYDFVYGALGIHPERVEELTDENLSSIQQMAASNSKIKAIGEVGLDYVNGGDKDEQHKLFIRQIGISRELGLPLVIHDREAHQDTLTILKQEKAWEVGGVMHCYSGSKEMLRQVFDLNMHIGIGGVVTFKNAVKVREVVEALPHDRLIVETDAPYLTAVPHRGHRNRSDYIAYVIEQIASIWNVSPEMVENITYDNGKKLFKI